MQRGKNEWSSKFSRFESAGLSRMRSMQENYHYFRRSLRRLMSWKSPVGYCRRAATKNTLTRRCRTSSSAWLHTWYCDCHWWSLWASAVTLSIIKSASSSHHQQTGSFHIHQQTTGEQNTKLEKWGLFWLKQYNFIIFRYISTKPGVKVYFLA